MDVIVQGEILLGKQIKCAISEIVDIWKIHELKLKEGKTVQTDLQISCNKFALKQGQPRREYYELVSHKIHSCSVILH